LSIPPTIIVTVGRFELLVLAAFVVPPELELLELEPHAAIPAARAAVLSAIVSFRVNMGRYSSLSVVTDYCSDLGGSPSPAGVGGALGWCRC
jgi:hypothetical protein